MPLTFPSHGAAVMPLKIRRPQWCDGVALMVGSAPNLPYAVGAPLPTYGHTWAGLALWGVPLSVVATPSSGGRPLSSPRTCGAGGVRAP
ncbi:DUF4184 family protein [Streptomyces sp. NPDC006465]|uniref:DUF4184 family protein n=1 Tax=Streptomyces sp. NPDC006465 TaxID=3157174 RepID=UPI0033A404FC